MLKPESSTRFIKEKLTPLVAVALGCTVLSGCGLSRKDYSSTPTDRYSYDYGSTYTGGTDGKVGCLDGAAYESSKVVVLFDGEKDLGKVLVKTNTGKLPDLHFDGYQNENLPLQPTDDYTKEVLVGAGCYTTKTNN